VSIFDPSMAAQRSDGELSFKDPELQAAALKAFPQRGERRRMIQALLSHPKLDVVAGPRSPHRDISCETCHVTTDRAYDRSLRPDRLDRWQRFHMEYHPVLKTLPLRLTDRTQSVCLKCHLGEEPLEGAETLNRGRVVYERMACYACHVTPGMKTREQDLSPGEKRMRKPGPPLDSIASKVDKRWTYNWLYHPWSFKPAARMPPLFPRNELGLPPQLWTGAPWSSRPNSRLNPLLPRRLLQNPLQAEAPPDLCVEQERVMAACVAEYIFSVSKPRELAAIPPGLLETEDWRIDDQVERGRHLVVQVGCLGCHKIDEDYAGGYLRKRSFLQEEFATNLFGSGDKFDSDLGRRWLFKWLKKPHAWSADTAMPDFRLTDEEIGDIVQFLLSLKVDNGVRFERGLKSWLPAEPPLAIEEGGVRISEEAEFILDSLVAFRGGPLGAPTRDRILWYGREVAEVFGCYSCHPMPGEWADRPAVEGPLHRDILPSRAVMERMPLMEPTPDELNASVVYVWAQFEALDPFKNKKVMTASDRARVEGERLLNKYHCGGCHVLEELTAWIRDGERIVRSEIQYKARVERTRDSERPHWAIEWLRDPKTLRFDALSEKYPALVPEDKLDRWLPGRGGTYNERRMALASPDERADLYRLLPPSLRSVGRKLRPEWLREFLKNPRSLRPIPARMPTFAFEEGEIESLAAYFRLRDGAAEEDESGRLTQQQVEARFRPLLAADAMIRTDCAACHAVEGKGSDKSVDLARVHERLQRPWLVAFLTKPSSIYPRTSMPEPPRGAPIEDLADALLNFDRLRLAKVRLGGLKEILEALESNDPALVSETLARVAREEGLEEAAERALQVAVEKGVDVRSQVESLVAHRTAAVRRLALIGLLRMGGSLKAALAALEDVDGSVRRAAVAAVRVLAGPQGAARIAGLIADPDTAVRLDVLVALEELGAQAQSERIAEALKDPDAGVRSRAARLLGALDAKGQAESLRRALKDDDKQVQFEALLALARTGQAAPADYSAEEPWLKAAHAACRPRSPEVQELLRLDSMDKATQRALALALTLSLPEERLDKPIEPGSRTAIEWLKTLGADSRIEEGEADRLLIVVTTWSRSARGLMSDLLLRAGVGFIERDSRLTAVPIEALLRK
jgi:HEAT repeat protein/mono/diheme cytochrome c family protein